MTGVYINNQPFRTFINAPDSTFADNPTLTKRLFNGASYANYGSTSTGGLNSIAELLAGVVTGTGASNSDVRMQWRTRTTNEAGASGPTLMSNILDLDGVAVVSGLQRDLFVLQMSYDPAAAATSPSDIYLATYDGGAWVNAISTNLGNNATGGQLGYVGSFAQFQIDYPGALNSYIGAYGVDPVAKTAWAVLNHNSEFAVIPEPSLLVVGGLATLGLASVGIRRRRASQLSQLE